MASLLILWRHRQWGLLGLVVVLALLLRAEYSSNGELRAQLAAKPAVQEREVVRTVRGPVRVVTRTIEKPVFVPANPGSKGLGSGRLAKERIIERVEERGWSVRESSAEHVETPQAAPRRPRWVVGGSLHRFQTGRYLDIAYAGYSLGGRLDLLYGFDLGGGPRPHHLTLLWRF